MTRNLVQLCHQRVKWILINQRNLYVIVLTKDFVKSFARLYARITSTNDEYSCFHTFPSVAQFHAVFVCYCPKAYR